MTTAVAVKKRGRTVVAADTQETFGNRKVFAAEDRPAKVLRIGSSYLAQTGWSIYGNVIADYLPEAECAPALCGEKEIFAFFQSFWRVLHERYSFVDDKSDANFKSPFADLDATFMVVNASGIFLVSAAMCVTEFGEYCAIGSGSSYALGALHALYPEDLDADCLARRACEAAIHYDLYTGGTVQLFAV